MMIGCDVDNDYDLIFFYHSSGSIIPTDRNFFNIKLSLLELKVEGKVRVMIIDRSKWVQVRTLSDKIIITKR